MIHNLLVWGENEKKKSAVFGGSGGSAAVFFHKSTLYPIKATTMPNHRVLLLF